MGLLTLGRSHVAVIVAALMLAGCNGVRGQNEVTGSISSPTQEGYRKLAETWSKRYQASPGDKTASLNYARALRGLDEREQAVSVLQQAAARNPDDPDVLAAYGKALVEIGQLDQARIVLSRAHTPDMPNARILSAQAVIADQSGEHRKAQELYHSALKQDPNDPVILTNLGLSLILSRQSREAEIILRRAVASTRADARMRETLALALIINGRNEEAVSVVGVDLSAEAARRKVAQMQQSAAGEGLASSVKSAQTADPPLRLATAAPKPKALPDKPNLRGLGPENATTAKSQDAPAALRSTLSD